MPNALMWVARNAKARPTARPIAVWLATSNRSEGVINAGRLLAGMVLTPGNSRRLTSTAGRQRCLLLPRRWLEKGTGKRQSPFHASTTSDAGGHRAVVIVGHVRLHGRIRARHISVAVAHLLADCRAVLRSRVL